MSTLERRLQEALAGPEDQAPVGRAARILLEDAAEASVSDIHLTPSATELEVHYRVDGVLRRAAGIRREWAQRFIGKIKVLSGLLTYQTDVPQDGQIPAAEAGVATDVRVSIFPTLHGEKAVLRFFHPDDLGFDLARLGFPAAIEESLRTRVQRPDGVILLTGPSGSGKTTTIYALLREIVSPASGAPRHVVTIEDPVEHAIPGVTQSQVNPAVGLTFASSLRSLLRQDPQVIMVGEIRDRETAHVAMEAGLTGHLVISTIHSGTVAGVVIRLLEMGVEPHVLTASLSCVLAQRLVRRTASEDASGFRGRQVFGELLNVDDEIRAALGKGPTRDDIETRARASGMVPLREAGEALVRAGATTAEELRRVIG